ncbi:sll0787 family AIR synthase-like protein [Almyronema epifaneia]|uniref:Sll0787 family AIR synthase-like protein n=1 Tax=Almyronema epifaneia S1 TaxID=2991925 RepID=A0ABW6IB09_9CYAN
MLAALATELRQTLGLRQKQDIQAIAQRLPGVNADTSVLLGDDCAAIADGSGYLLLAAEGIWPTLVETDPWFAGWSSVLVNVSDIYAMGGRPLAVVDTLWSQSAAAAAPLWDGMIAAAQTFAVPIVGGHTSCRSPYNALSVAILGRAQALISSFKAQPGDTLLLVSNFRGKAHPDYPFWDAATQADPVDLRSHLNLLPQLAEAGLCDAGKDISMGGLLGTLLMLLETSGCGAILQLDQVPYPAVLSLKRWLLSFPSYGFLLSVRPHVVSQIQKIFTAQDLICAAVGTVTSDRLLTLTLKGESDCFWDLNQTALTGFGAS